MSYYESAEGMTITSKRARHEIETHGCSFDEFQHESGLSDYYDAQEVLSWLGY